MRARLLCAALLASAACSESTGLGPSGALDAATDAGDARASSDAGLTDRGASDASSDAGLSDTGASEAGGGVQDGGAPSDAGLGDFGILDAGLLDIGPSDSGPADTGPSCDFMTPPAADRDRVVLVGHPFGMMAGQDGHTIRSLTLTAQGTLQDNGMRLDVGTKPARIEFIPAATLALVLGEDGHIVSVDAEQPGALAIRGTAMLPSAQYGDLVISPDGHTAWAVGFDSTAQSGISTLHLACDGSLSIDAPLFFGTRLSQSMAFIPGTARAILLGGQATFAPVDPYDTRMLALTPTGAFSLLAVFDIWHDDVDCGRIGISPNGRTLIVPNGSAFSTEGGEVSVIDVDARAQTLTERRRLMNLPDAREALFSPDGTVALVSLEQPNKIAVLTDQGQGFTVTATLTGIGLPDKMAAVPRGALAGRVLAAAVDPNGTPNLAQITAANGQAMNLGMFSLGPNNTDIPGPVAISP